MTTHLPIPTDLRSEVEAAQRLGAMLHRYDQAAAVATDVMLAHVRSPQERGIGGYLALRQTDEGTTTAWRVPFFLREEPYRIACQIHLSRARDERPRFEAFDPARPAPAELRSLMVARRTAIAAIATTEPPRQPINPVVLAGSSLGLDGTVVYLLAASRDPEVVVLGQHHRIHVASDGKTILRQEALSRSIIEISRRSSDLPAGAQPAGLWVTHLVSACPTEAHVFASLLHDTQICVGTSRGSWSVEGDRISLLQEGAPGNAPSR